MTQEKYLIHIFYHPLLTEVYEDDWGPSHDANSFDGKFGKKVIATIDPAIEMKKRSGLKLYETTAALPLVMDSHELKLIKYDREKNLLGAVIVVEGKKRFSDIVRWTKDSFDEPADGWKESTILDIDDHLGNNYEWDFYLVLIRHKLMK